MTQMMAWASVLAVCAAVAAAQATSAAPAAGQRTDGQIEMDVVQALDASPALKNDLITAATIQSEVTLAGTVSNEASRELAESIAAHVQGVTKVHDNLKIGNPADAQNEMAPNDSGADTAPMPDNEPNAAQESAQEPAPADQPQADAGPDQDQYPPQGQYPPQAGPGPDQGSYPGGQPPYSAGQSPYPQGRPEYQPQYPPQQPQYPQQQSQYPPQYPQPQPSAPAYEPAKGPVTIPPGTLLQLRTAEPVSTREAKDGTPVQFTVVQDVAFGGVLAIPRGATVHGVVTEVKKVGAGSLGGSPVLALTLTSLDLGGQSYPLTTDQFKVKGPNKAGRTVGNAIGGGILGAIIGCAVGRGVGCAVGAGAGVAAGTALSSASPGPNVWIPSEALVTFHLKAPVTVTPVSPQEAARLAQGLYQGGPTLYRRGGYYPYGPRFAGPYGSPYGYPPVYYRPYSMEGGFYYWR